ncbi:hypothetical protein L226DRAFT_537465 [Lentinus tigrinus ALCF2SS1-7]|uniref:Uncharacterized protein n=1 Tax=Lentinus tigrinus ALCF2SS1-6 TaxID=1328759 RepID=A0A5C2S3F6_9APHY|nr:hypothetical protein L227DRAFT_577973 [Lentinus tigrinus ALCF2SS1-6]RPD72033.1 hypothetical protein L226DRAFT_537465 [Lentinus tigrinus ALCF2SS1-7]
MEAQLYERAVRKTLRVFIPSVSNADDDEEWLDPLPSPPPPTPSHARREAPYDMQRFDPFRVMMASSTPHFTSPTSPEFAIDYPKLPDSLTFHFPALDEADSDHNDSTETHPDEADDLFADTEDLSPDSSFEIPTPADLSGDFSTTFHFGGADEEGEYEIDRTILRPAGKHPRFDLSGSLAKLATRSTATLRTMSSFTTFPRFSGGSISGESDTEDTTYAGITAPPASLLASRRPSVATGATPLSSPVSAAEVVKSLRKLASSLELGCAGQSVERHFEETVDHYERAWSHDEPIEVHVDRTEALHFEDDRFGFGFQARPDGVGLYADV